jgi:hypothetical protein
MHCSTRRIKRVAVSLLFAGTVLVGPLSGTAHAAESVRCRVLRNYLENKSPDSWMWRAASVEYGNYC